MAWARSTWVPFAGRRPVALGRHQGSARRCRILPATGSQGRCPDGDAGRSDQPGRRQLHQPGGRRQLLGVVLPPVAAHRLSAMDVRGEIDYAAVVAELQGCPSSTRGQAGFEPALTFATAIADADYHLIIGAGSTWPSVLLRMCILEEMQWIRLVQCTRRTSFTDPRAGRGRRQLLALQGEDGSARWSSASSSSSRIPRSLERPRHPISGRTVERVRSLIYPSSWPPCSSG